MNLALSTAVGSKTGFSSKLLGGAIRTERRKKVSVL